MLFIRFIAAIILAVLVGKLVSKLKLPAILGWLLAGMILGPHALNLLNMDIMQTRWYIGLQYIFECTVGIMIGSELVYSKLKEMGTKIVVTTLFQSLMTFAIVSICFAIIFSFVGLPLYLSVVFGSIALATAPAPALSIVKEFGTSGPVTKTLIPMAALDDIVGIIVFFSVNSTISAMHSETGASLLVTLAIMLLLPVVLGIPMGWIASKLLKKQKESKSIIVVTLLMVVLTALLGFVVNTYILPEPMLNFMLIGMVFSATFSNLLEEEQLEKVLESLNPIIGFALVVVILNLAAPLDYHLILGAGIFTFVYIASRAVGKYLGAYTGAKLTKLPDSVKKYLGLTLLPHSGVSLVFTGIIVTTIQGFDPGAALTVQGTIAAAAVINEIIAVLVAKKAFIWAGEIEAEV